MKGGTLVSETLFARCKRAEVLGRLNMGERVSMRSKEVDYKVSKMLEEVLTLGTTSPYRPRTMRPTSLPPC